MLRVGNKIIELLSKKKQKLEWDEKSFEHFFNYKDDKKQLHVVYYPTLKVRAINVLYQADPSVVHSRTT